MIKQRVAWQQHFSRQHQTAVTALNPPTFQSIRTLCFAPGLAPSRHVTSLAAVHASAGGAGPSTAILLVHRRDDFVSVFSDAGDHEAAEVDDDDDVAPRRQVPSMAVAFPTRPECE